MAISGREIGRQEDADSHGYTDQHPAPRLILIRGDELWVAVELRRKIDAPSSLGQSCAAPATDFQACAYEYSRLRGCGFVNYFIFRLRTPVGLGRIYAAAKLLLQRYSLLLTSLKTANDRLWQIVEP